MKPLISITASLLLLASGFAFALSTSPQESQPAADPYRQFDFWLGEWECFSQNGQLSGTNRIELTCGGRVLQEHWKGAGGGPGTSLNIYDAQTKRWHQTWVDSSGTLLLLDGELQEDGAMMMEGVRPGAGGVEVLHRIIWKPEGEQVRQTWSMSQDEGKTWRVLADLDYKKAKPKEEGSESGEGKAGDQ